MATEIKTRGRVWEHKETLLLLEKWGDESIELKLKSCTRKKPIWLHIAANLRAAGYEDGDDSSCKTRIHTLISAYRSYKDECTKTGNATPKKKPAFFDEVDELMSDKPCTKPKVTIKSATISIDGDGDGKKKQNQKTLSRTQIKRGKPRLMSLQNLTKCDKTFESFMEYQQAADKSFIEAEAARERREEERAEKRREEDQKFLLKLAQGLHN
ncbi:uncharacterized protein LOC111346504 [Stylophora pistillata]|uniref:uncharacterized protein LOC111346504 n=1 Tax=Stylophora pistillata TaxID=50429 RepID=UPI000C04539E|nr:uncharacterized protein LOC111346504 [Stylophora pistillata]